MIVRMLRWAGSLIGIGGTAMCLTIVSQGMRSVEKIGGSCASGNTPYQIARPCPAGVPGLLTGGIFAGLFFLALFSACVGPRGRPVAVLAWPALFLTLGWNFLDYGIHAPGGGLSPGALVCAVIFIIMGAVPLVWLVPTLFNALTGHDGGDDTARSPFALPPALATNVRLNPTTPTWPAAGTASTSATSTWPTSAPLSSSTTSTPDRGTDVATALDRLASLHAKGDLTDTEYEEAKRKTLETPRST